MNIKIGCDPELFLKDATGKIVSAEGVVPGTKEKPVSVKKGTVQADGFAAEIGIVPASSPNEFADNVETVLEELRRYTGPLSLEFIDSVVIPQDVFLKQSDKGRALGCDPDFNAYTKLQNNPPVPNPKEFRTAAGHIHIGWDEGIDTSELYHFTDCVNVAKQMDWCLGVPSVAWNMDSKRRALYGKAGAFRVKSYGCEYRTPDNNWLTSRAKMEYMASNTLLGMKQLYAQKHFSNQYNAQQFINSPNTYNNGYDYLAALKIPILQNEKKKVANA